MDEKDQSTGSQALSTVVPVISERQSVTGALGDLGSSDKISSTSTTCTIPVHHSARGSPQTTTVLYPNTQSPQAPSGQTSSVHPDVSSAVAQPPNSQGYQPMNGQPIQLTGGQSLQTVLVPSSQGLPLTEQSGQDSNPQGLTNADNSQEAAVKQDTGQSQVLQTNTGLVGQTTIPVPQSALSITQRSSGMTKPKRKAISEYLAAKAEHEKDTASAEKVSSSEDKSDQPSTSVAGTTAPLTHMMHVQTKTGKDVMNAIITQQIQNAQIVSAPSSCPQEIGRGDQSSAAKFPHSLPLSYQSPVAPLPMTQPGLMSGPPGVGPGILPISLSATQLSPLPVTVSSLLSALQPAAAVLPATLQSTPVSSSALPQRQTTVTSSLPMTVQHVESDMDTTSDSDSRLVVDSDTRTDDGMEDVQASEDEKEGSSSNALKQKIAIVDISKPSESSENVAQKVSTSSSLVMPETLLRSALPKTASPLPAMMSSSLGLNPGVGPHLPSPSIAQPPGATAPRQPDPPAIPPRAVIPSVVSDLGMNTEQDCSEQKQPDRPSPRKSDHSLPANISIVKLLDASKSNLHSKAPLPMGTEDSLLKVNKPKVIEPLLNRPQVVQDIEGMEQSQRNSLPSNYAAMLRPASQQAAWQPAVPPHVREMAVQVKPPAKPPTHLMDTTTVKAEPPVSRPQVPAIQSLPVDVKLEPAMKGVDEKSSIPVVPRSSEDVKPPSGPTFTTTVTGTVDLLKDVGSSEDQVNYIIRKYNILRGSAEKREVSVKDMRRVIPQLIMCLYSKDDHHARKVKGLWEKKPARWPDSIPYCDPNNSNRGGEGGGKPKKETLHKMFAFLLDQYLQKYMNDLTFPAKLMDVKAEGISPGSQPVLVQSMREQLPTESAAATTVITQTTTSVYQRPPASYRPGPNSLPANVSVNNKKFMFLASGDLSSIAKPVFPPPGTLESDKLVQAQLKQQAMNTLSSHPITSAALAHNPKSVPYSTYTSQSQSKVFSDILLPPPKRLKTGSATSDMKDGADGLPTVVGLHSPVSDSADVDKITDSVAKQENTITSSGYLGSLPAGHLSPMQSVFFPQTLLRMGMSPMIPTAGLSTCGPQNVATNTQLTANLSKDSHLSSSSTIPFSMFKNTGLVCPIVNDSNQLSPLHSSQSELGKPVVSSNLISSSAHSLPMNLQNIPPMIHIPTNPDLQHIITSKAVSGIPIVMPKDGQSPLLIPPSMLSTGSIPSASPSDPMSSPVRLMGPPAMPSLPSIQSNMSPAMPPDVSSRLQASLSQQTLPNTATPSRDSLGSKEHSASPVSQGMTSIDLPRTHHSTLSHTESEAASAILLLSKPPETPRLPQTITEPELRVETTVPSMDSDYQSLEASRISIPAASTPNLSNFINIAPQNNLSPHPLNFHVPSRTGQQSDSPQPGYRAADTQHPLSTLSRAQVVHKSPGDSNLYVSPQSYSPAGVPTPPRRELSPSSETDSCEEELPIKPDSSPSSGEDNKPMSLILHSRPEIPLEESVAVEVSKDETYNPISEAMERVGNKVKQIIQMNSDQRFPKKDLSVLMIAHDILIYKKESLRQKDMVEFLLTAHKLEASLDIALLQRLVPESLRAEWRDYSEKNEKSSKKHIIVDVENHKSHYHELSTSLIQEEKFNSCESIESLTNFAEIKSAINNILEYNLQEGKYMCDNTDKTVIQNQGPVDISCEKFTTKCSIQYPCDNQSLPDTSGSKDRDYEGPPWESNTVDLDEGTDVCQIRQAPVTGSFSEYLMEKTSQDNKHTSTGFHNYAKKRKRKSDRSSEQELKDKPKSETDSVDSNETVIHISKGQKCVPLNSDSERKIVAQLDNIPVKLRFAICSEALIEDFSKMNLTQDDLKDVAIICFHDPSMVAEQAGRGAVDELATEKIIQIVEDLRQSAENAADSRRAARTQDDLSARSESPVFSMDNIDIVVVDKDLESDIYGGEGDDSEEDDDDDQDSLPSLSGITNCCSAVMNTEEADLFEACGASLLPPLSEMEPFTNMVAAIETEFYQNAPASDVQ